MKVFILTNRFNVGGISKVIGTFASGLQQRGITIYLYGGNLEQGEKSDEEYFRNLNIKIHVFKYMRRSINPFYDLYTIFKFYFTLLKIRPDVLFTHASKAGFIGRVASVFYPYPLRVLHQYHGSIFEHYFNKTSSKIYLFVEKILSYFTNDIIVVSEKVYFDIVYRYRIANSSKVHVVNLGINTNKFNQSISFSNFRIENNIDLNTTILLCVGRLVPVKNHTLFIDIISNLKAKLSNKIVGIIVGDGELLDFLMKYCNDSNLTYSYTDYKKTDIWFTSWRNDLVDIYNESNFVLLTSLNEGFPVSLLEGMSCGKVVISSKVGGVPDMIDFGVDGFFCENSINIFSNIIQALLLDPEKCLNIGYNARMKIVTKYTEDCMVDRLISILNFKLK